MQALQGDVVKLVNDVAAIVHQVSYSCRRLLFAALDSAGANTDKMTYYCILVISGNSIQLSLKNIEKSPLCLDYDLKELNITLNSSRLWLRTSGHQIRTLVTLFWSPPDPTPTGPDRPTDPPTPRVMCRFHMCCVDCQFEAQ